MILRFYHHFRGPEGAGGAEEGLTSAREEEEGWGQVLADPSGSLAVRKR